jgi:hypothetical protein
MKLQHLLKFYIIMDVVSFLSFILPFPGAFHEYISSIQATIHTCK